MSMIKYCDYTKMPVEGKIKICPICGRPGFYNSCPPKSYTHKIKMDIPDRLPNPEGAPVAEAGTPPWEIEDECRI
jgi:hypothetical protein